MRKQYLSGKQEQHKISKGEEIPRVKRKYVRRVFSRTEEGKELRRSGRILSTPGESISSDTPSGHHQTSTIITNPTISHNKPPIQPPISLLHSPNLRSESPISTPSSISHTEIHSGLPSHHRESSSSLSPPPSDFTPTTPPPKPLHDSVIVRSPLPKPSSSSPSTAPRQRGQPRKNRESVQTAAMQFEGAPTETAREVTCEESNGSFSS